MLSTHALVFTCEAFAGGDADRLGGLRESLRRMRAFAAVDRVELFTPHPDYARVPIFKDGPPPAAIVEILAPSLGPLRALAEAGELASTLGQGAEEWHAGLFDVVHQPVDGKTPMRDEAKTSFVVRYYPPVSDTRSFAEHYVARHPPLLARFPKIRNVLCYVPTGEQVSGLHVDETVIRNEVVFDSVSDLIAALQSPVIAELRADTQTFPPFGHSTHHAMRRESLYVNSGQAGARLAVD